jgi:hypothetical protein
LPDILRQIIRARKLGSAIIPVIEGGKAPAIDGGHKAASKDWKKPSATWVTALLEGDPQ